MVSDMATTEKHQCEKKIRRGERWHRYDVDCPNPGIVERDGKWYCGGHDPVKVKERKDARQAEWDRQRKNDDKHRRRLDAETHYCANLTTEYLEKNQGEVTP